MKLFNLIAGFLLGVLLIAQPALADKAVAPARVEPAKAVIPVQVKHADLKGEGDGVQAKIVLPARLREAAAGAKAPGKVGLNEGAAPTQRSIVAALALSLAAVSVVFVLRGKNVNVTSKAAVLGVTALLAIFGAAQADIPVPGGNRRPPRPVPPPVPVAKSNIVIEFSSDVEEAILTLPAK